MDNAEIRSTLRTEKYDFLRTNPLLGENIILLTLGGSHAYGTDIETSDLDIRGCAIENRRQILTGHSFEQVIDNPTDTTIYSLRKLVSLLLQCNPNIIEILGCEPEDYFIITGAGQILLDNKDLFLSKAAYRSFSGYASSQLRRLDNKTAKTFSQEDTEKHILKRLSEMNRTPGLTFSLCPTDREDLEQEICISGEFTDMPFRRLYTELGELNQTLREYERNSKRNKYAATHGKICKHATHLLRLYMMVENILLEGKIVTRRKKEHDLLMDIRNGKYLGEDGQMLPEFFEMVRDYENRAEMAYRKSELPPHVNMKKVDEMLIRIYEEYVLAE